MPSVSVILPIYNGEKYIENTINSILTQSFNHFELIVVDDGSKDSSAQIVKKFAEKDNRILYISQCNSGICNARNVGIQKARSPYIMFCDHDDIYLPGYIGEAFHEINNSGVDFVKYGCRELYVKDDVVYKKNDCTLKDQEYCMDIKEILLAYENYNEYIWDGIYSKKVLLKVGLFDPAFMAGCEDIDLILKLVQSARSCKTSSKIFYEHYIRSSSSTSRKYSENSYESVLKILKKRMEIVGGDTTSLLRYKNKKTAQFLWAILGMFSFKSCNLSISQMRKRLIQLKEINEFTRSLKTSDEAFQKRLVVGFYKMKMYGILALLCKIKRSIGT